MNNNSARRKYYANNHFKIPYKIISKTKAVNNRLEITEMNFLENFSIIFLTKGTITYIRNKLDTPKNKIDLKQIYPFIFPKIPYFCIIIPKPCIKEFK